MLVIRELWHTLRPWKWVFVYTAFLFLNANYARRLVDWLTEYNLLALLSISLMIIAFACVVFLFRRIYRNEGRPSFSVMLRLAAFLAGYAYFVVTSAVVMVERVHFVQYGILGVLCHRAVNPHYGACRRISYTLAVVFLVGFIDEVIQGLLPSRYYDIRDIRLNVIAGGLPLVAFYLLPQVRGEEKESDRQELPSTATGHRSPLLPLLRLPDLSVLIVGVVLFFLTGWIEHGEWDPSLLVGSWERTNKCGTVERMQVEKDGFIRWEDTAGRSAQGSYQVRGNRLDGPLLQISVADGITEPVDPCGWKEKERRDRYFEAGEERLLFKNEPNLPFWRNRE